MHDSSAHCTKCGGEMEGGFLVDTIFPGNAMLEPQGENLLWAKGSRDAIPKPTWFSKLTSRLGFPISSADTKAVTTLRCVRCGLS
jgi:hypothetical protein